MSWLVFGVFTVAGLAATAAAWTGWTGEAGVRGVGWTLPARVEADPALLREANRLVTTWCTAAALLSAVPVVLLALRGLREPLSLPMLLASAVYGFGLVLVGGYPFERIELLGDDGDGPSGR